jgi:hypothetical protein
MSSAANLAVSTWSHATNSPELLAKALSNDQILSIECDILMGRDMESGDIEQPILAHPPSRESNLSVASFVNQITVLAKDGDDSNHQTTSKERRILKKHIKLDFKELAAFEPSMTILQQAHIINPLQKNIFLNADILPGPGNRRNNHVPAKDFIEAGVTSISNMSGEDSLNVSRVMSYDLACCGNQSMPFDCHLSR